MYLYETVTSMKSMKVKVGLNTQTLKHVVMQKSTSLQKLRMFYIMK
jgi:hypothetical protein